MIWVLSGPGVEGAAPWPQRYLARYLRAVKLLPREQGRVIVAVTEVPPGHIGEVRFPPQLNDRGPVEWLTVYEGGGAEYGTAVQLNTKRAEPGESFIVTDAMRLIVVKPMGVTMRGRGGVSAP